jgi:E3 ubiquitin-protein ligase SHPRH
LEQCEPLGIETAKYATMINILLEEALNANAVHLWNLRGQVIERLMNEVDFKSDSATATGEEFEATLQAQAMLEAYISSYIDAVTDRREMLTDRGTFLQEVQRKKGKQRATRTSKEVRIDIPEDEDDAKFVRKIKATRYAYRLAFADGQSLQGIISELDDFASQHEGRIQEAQLARMERQRLKDIKEKQLGLLKHLEDEAKALNQCFNIRLTYYKTLQQISDTLVSTFQHN